MTVSCMTIIFLHVGTMSKCTGMIAHEHTVPCQHKNITVVSAKMKEADV